MGEDQRTLYGLSKELDVYMYMHVAIMPHRISSESSLLNSSLLEPYPLLLSDRSTYKRLNGMGILP